MSPTAEGARPMPPPRAEPRRDLLEVHKSQPPTFCGLADTGVSLLGRWGDTGGSIGAGGRLVARVKCRRATVVPDARD